MAHTCQYEYRRSLCKACEKLAPASKVISGIREANMYGKKTHRGFNAVDLFPYFSVISKGRQA